jgi:cell division protein FtsQ
MRQKLSRLWFSMLCLTAVAVVGMTFFGVWRSGQNQHLFALKTLQIQSRFERLSAEQIRAAIKTEVTAGFFSVDLAATRAQLKALPWVAQVEVRKRWPDTVLIRLIERTATARWGKLDLLDANGEVFRVSGAGAMHGLVHLSGPASRRLELVQFHQTSEPVLRNLSLHLTKARFSKRGALTLKLSDGSKIILGREQQMPRWQRFVDNLPTLRAKNQGLQLLEIDLRYTNGLAARFAPAGVENQPRAPQAPPAPSTAPTVKPAATIPRGPALLAGSTGTGAQNLGVQVQNPGAAR